MNNYKLVISYDGTNYIGFQKQKIGHTIQSVIELAIRKVFREYDCFNASGRTDTGVHAEGQVVSFCTSNLISAKNVLNALNSNLPDDVIVLDAEIVGQDYRARRSAKTRLYNYLFTADSIPIYLRDQISLVRFKVEESVFKNIEDIFYGKHDFVNFRKLGSNERSTIREIVDFRIEKMVINSLYSTEKNYVIYRVIIEANSFLYSMVRSIVGSIFEVLRSKRTVKELRDMLNLNDKFNYTIAESKGLSLVKVNY